ncbi:M56 family metallopeptidase [Shewanella corallii]|uniref:Protein TonB n=1 Tax=Shewanella corallii TaxID=560080 RepID=A0ABT0N612_9GAMM|nr:M56 family metallopeptidase [Shewanella corallii]MCL2913830.1 M56 family metallopeptidase [Shewanella corallii]
MMAFLSAQFIGLTLICVLLLVSSQQRAKGGADLAYLYWWLVPLQLLTGLLVTLWPAWFAAAESSLLADKISYYSVKAIASQEHVSSWFWPSLLFIWLGGAALMWATALLQWLKVRALLAHGQPIELISSPLPAWLVDSDSAMLAGVRNPVLLLPRTFPTLSAFEQQSIIRHELVHWHRRDIPANLMAWSLLSLCWFNPICHLAYRRFRQEQELACDASVCRNMNKDQRIAYGRLLLAQAQSRPLAMLATQSGNKHTLKERIMQLKHHNMAGRSLVVAMVLVGAMGLVALFSSQQLIAGESKRGDHPYPKVRIEPTYPAKAVENKLEGYVQLSFDITPAGKVNNIKVLKSLPEGVFDQSAAEALAQWQYEASSQGASGSKVQLDYLLAPADEVERISVTAR